MSVSRELHGLIDDLLEGEPRQALAAYRRLVEDQLPWLERKAVLAARQEQYQWAGIGRLLGRSRQAVQQRFDREFSADELAPVEALRCPGAAQERKFQLDGSYYAQKRFVDEAGDDGSLVPW